MTSWIGNLQCACIVQGPILRSLKPTCYGGMPGGDRSSSHGINGAYGHPHLSRPQGCQIIQAIPTEQHSLLLPLPTHATLVSHSGCTVTCGKGASMHGGTANTCGKGTSLVTVVRMQACMVLQASELQDTYRTGCALCVYLQVWCQP